MTQFIYQSIYLLVEGVEPVTKKSCQQSDVIIVCLFVLATEMYFIWQ